MIKKGLLVSFEGIEGSGKGTQINLLTAVLKENKIPCQVIREPGTTSLGKQIREILLHRQSHICIMSELLLFLAARKQLIEEKLVPELSHRQVIILDRYTDSTLAYQGTALPLELIESLHEKAEIRLKADLTFYLKIDYQLSLKRQKQRNEKQDFFEQKKQDYFNAVLNNYQKIADREPERFKVIEADQDLTSVHQQVLKIWQKYEKNF